MTAERRGPPPPRSGRPDGRYIRWAHRYATWQVKNRDGEWVNVRPELAECYAAAGFRVAQPRRMK